MAAITYTAKRSLMDGHVAGQSYEFEVLLSDWTPDSDPETSSSTSLSGRKFTTLHRIEKSFSAQTIPVDKLGDEAELANQIAEWRDSVAAGEAFTIDPLGTLGDDPLEVELDGKVRESLYNSVGYYTYSFKVRRLS